LTNRRAIARTPKIMLVVSFHLVFSNWIHVAIAIALTGIFWIIFNVFDQLVFFSPIITFYLPEEAIVGFILSNIAAVLIGVVVSMNLYVLKHSKILKKKVGSASLFSGSTLGIVSSACASCSSSIGFLLVSSFGGVGATALAFLSNYQIPLRILSILLLIWALYSISDKLKKGCTIISNKQKDDTIKNIK
jgi:hypothetical protein